MPPTPTERGEPLHAEVLAAARRLSREPDGTFRIRDVARALPHRNERSIRTHVASRCCVNAPAHHPHRWPYFLRVGRGIYRITPGYRREPAERPGVGAAGQVAEPLADFASRAAERSTIHAVIVKSEDWFVAECLEVAVVTQGRTLDETIANLHESLALHLEDDERTESGLTPRPRLLVTYETNAFVA